MLYHLANKTDFYPLFFVFCLILVPNIVYFRSTANMSILPIIPHTLTYILKNVFCLGPVQ